MRILSKLVFTGMLLIGLADAAAFAQQDSSGLTCFKPGRFATVVGTESSLAVASLVGLNELWYKNYPRSSFHFFNDNAEWLQMDKLGHAYTSYQIGRLGYAALRWSGVREKKSVWHGGASGLAYQLIIEMLDGFSTQWGFSAGDFAGNIGGAALFTSQQLLWHEQRIQMKFSYRYSRYAELRPEILGSTAAERLLKDYNGQTYWLSLSPGSFMKDKKRFPSWICFSLGMGADGMLGARDNLTLPNIDTDIQRSRLLYLSMDVDFSKIPVRNKFWHTVLSALNSLKAPFPTLSYNITKNQIGGYWLY